MAAALGHCSWWSWFCPRLDWLDVDMGDMLSSVSVGVERPSYDDEPFALYGLFPLLVPPRSESSAHERTSWIATHCMISLSSVTRLTITHAWRAALCSGS